MGSTYRAVEISSPGVFSPVERKTTVPGAWKEKSHSLQVVVAELVCHPRARTIAREMEDLNSVHDEAGAGAVGTDGASEVTPNSKWSSI